MISYTDARLDQVSINFSGFILAAVQVYEVTVLSVDTIEIAIHGLKYKEH